MSSEIKREILRKSLHLPGLFVPLLYSYIPKLTLSLLFSLSMIYLINEWFRIHQKKSPIFIANYLSSQLTRSSKLDLAPVYLSLGLGLTVFFFPFKAALAGALLVCGGDVLAAIVGMQWGKHKIFLTQKTYLGTLTFFISSFLFLSLILGWKIALPISIISSFIEVFSAKGLDNFFLPIVGSFLTFKLLN